MLMKVLKIIAKDMLRTFSSIFVLAFMLVLPLLQAGIPYLAFGGMAGGLDIQKTHLQVVNLDQPVAEYGDFTTGELLVAYLQGEGLANLLQVSLSADEASARAEVEARRADVAVIIPAELTAAVLDPETTAAILLFKDPALTLGPAVVKSILIGFTDGLAGSLTAADIVSAQLAEQGIPLDETARQELMRKYGAWANSVGESLSRGQHPAIAYLAPAEMSEANPGLALIGPLMLGMMVFFTFFIGAIQALTILYEYEHGTLMRMFSTPTRPSTILAGKFLGVMIALGIQVIVLVSVGALLFGIHWGSLPQVILAGIGLIVIASGFGILMVAFLKSTRQAFLVIGGIVILTSTAGGTMTTTFANLPPVFNTLNLLTPQGWALKTWEVGMRGGSLGELVLPFLVTLAIAQVFYLIGGIQMRRRFGQ
jgi:ABC-2 type transport system permease protein